MTSDSTRDAAVHKKTKELLESDPDLKRMAEKSPYRAFKAAIAKAAQLIPPAKAAGSGGAAALSRDDRLRALTLTLLKTDPDLRELAKENSYAAHRRAFKAASIKLRAFESEWARTGDKSITLGADESRAPKRRNFRQGEGGKFRVSNAEGLPLTG